MKRSLVIDTDVMVDYLRGHRGAVEFVERNADRMILSCIVVAELFAGARGEQELNVLDRLVSAFRVIPITKEIARAGGLTRREYGPSHGVGLADALLAATAMAEHADLATLNVKHYPMLKGLKAAYSKLRTT